MYSREQYFPDITFSPISASKSPELGTVVLQTSPAIASTVYVNRLTSSPLADPISEALPSQWTPEQALDDFQSTMRHIRASIEHALPNTGRVITFVPFSELLPKDPEKLKALVEKYGTHILKGSRGDCRIDEKGVYQIRIADLRGDPNTTYERVLGTIAHEYGHSLGDFIENPILEEMKAEAFKQIFLRVFNGADVYLQDGYEATSRHEVARNRIAQLMVRGIPEEAILAHLTNKRFGRFNPEDYKRLNGKGLIFNPTPVGIGNQGIFSLS